MRRWRALESVGMDSGDGKCGKWNLEDWRHSENPDLGEAAAAGCLRVHRGRARVNVSAEGERQMQMRWRWGDVEIRRRLEIRRLEILIARRLRQLTRAPPACTLPYTGTGGGKMC